MIAVALERVRWWSCGVLEDEGLRKFDNGGMFKWVDFFGIANFSWAGLDHVLDSGSGDAAASSRARRTAAGRVCQRAAVLCFVDLGRTQVIAKTSP